MDIRHFSGYATILIDPDRIDLNPGPYCMSFGFEIEPLASSIQAIGLINVPYVTGRKDGLYDIVAGYRRIKALISLNQKEMPCIDLSGAGLSALELLFLNLHDNLTTRGFNPVEKGMILNRLILHMPRSRILEYYAPLLGISGHRDLDTLFRIEELVRTGKELLANGSLSLKAAGLILGMDDRAQSTVIKWLSSIKLNFNQQLKFIEYIDDIAIKEGKNIHELLNEDTFSTLLQDNLLNTPQRAGRLLDLLRERRFPLLRACEKAFQEEIKGLDLPKGVRLRHPPFFEGPEYLLEVAFKDGKGLKETIDALARTDGLEKIRDPWEEDP